jgi:hypothetical protein
MVYLVEKLKKFVGGINMLDFRAITTSDLINIVIAIVAFIAFIVSYCDYRSRKSKESADKSILIAKEFEKNLLTPMATISGLVNNKDMQIILNKYRFTEFIEFDREEMKEFYTNTEIEQYKRALEKIETEKDSGKFESIYVDIETVLNKLEYLSMYITSKVADEKYIYNSLHQMFFKTIQVLYIHISSLNSDNKDKYYTNVIELYNIWTNKYVKDCKKEKRYKLKTKPQNHKTK